jgi:hypothetical protein
MLKGFKKTLSAVTILARPTSAGRYEVLVGDRMLVTSILQQKSPGPCGLGLTVG